MNDFELDKLADIFYNEAPYDYMLDIDNTPHPMVRGVCDMPSKVCVIVAPESYKSALWTMLHEIAHARMQSGHTFLWEKEFVRLLKKYGFVADDVLDHTTKIGPNMKEWLNGNA